MRDQWNRSVGSAVRTGFDWAADGSLSEAATKVDPVFGLNIPTMVEGVPSEVLEPRDCWADGAAYDAQAYKLAEMFRENIKKFGDAVAPAVLLAGPHAWSHG